MIVWHTLSVSKDQRSIAKKQKPFLLWLTGLSGSGKSTIANLIDQELFAKGYHTYILDGDNIRHGLNADLGFDEKSRKENLRRIREVARLFLDAGIIVICATISPFLSDRYEARQLIGKDDFIEIFVDAPLEVCADRDPKGLYKKAKTGEIRNFTGLESLYEKPISPEIHINNFQQTAEENVKHILDFLTDKGYINV